MPVGVSWANLADQKIVFMNRMFTEIFGYVAGDFMDISAWIQHYPLAEDRDLALEKWGTYFLAPTVGEFDIEPIELRVRCKDGAIKTVIHSGVILPDTGWALATFVDITDRKHDELMIQDAEHHARENEAIYRVLLDHSPDMIVLAPFDQSRRYCSPAVQQITGFTAEEYLAMKPIETVHPEDREDAARMIEEVRLGKLSQVFRYRIVQKKGGHHWVEAIITGYIDPTSGATSGYVGTVRDIYEQKKNEELSASEFRELSVVAALDELTGIANRRTFNRSLKSAVSQQGRTVRDLSVLLVDVDWFKQFNDLYGHLPGDTCLKKIAGALATSMRRDADLVARYGGEEFVVLLPLTDAAGAEIVARHILKVIAALAIPHAGSPYGYVTVSIGAATWEAGDSLNQATLLDRADRALYEAKAAGRNHFQKSGEDQPIPAT